MKTTILLACSATALLCVVAPATAQVPYSPAGTPIPVGEELFATGGDVTVTFVGRGAAVDTDLLYLFAPANTAPNPIFDNQTSSAGDMVDLGTFAAGTELEFGMDNASTGNTFYTGPGTRNPDGFVHAYIVNDYNGNPSQEYVGFEDEAAPNSDFNYTDVQFIFTGTQGAAAPDSASTLTLLGMGLAGLTTLSRRFKK